MKNNDQLRFTYFDVIPANPKKPMTAKPLAGSQSIPVESISDKNKPLKSRVSGKSKAQKANPKEARLIFYSRLASQNGPTVRLRRPVNNKADYTSSSIQGGAIDSFMENLDFELPDENTAKPTAGDRIRSWLAWMKDKMKSLMAALGNAKLWFTKLKNSIDQRDVFTKKKLDFNRLKFAKKHNKKTYLLIALFVLSACALILGANQLVNNYQQKSSRESQAQADWEVSKKEWECALARYEAEQSNKVLDNNKEKSCANIN